MTPTQIKLVQQTWETVFPIREQAAALFYNRLFVLNPRVRPLFKGDIKVQGEKLMAMIDAGVRGLHSLDTLVPVVRDLGKRHAGYGVSSDHYGTVGAALLWTLEKGLADAFTPEVREAWTAVYGVLASTMQEGAAAGASGAGTPSAGT
jgi:hemoglobin-like flavoprotein